MGQALPQLSRSESGLFTGIANCHQNNFDGIGPNGLVIAGDDIYAGSGNSHVLGFGLRTGQLIADYNTGGKLQADELTIAGRCLPPQSPNGGEVDELDISRVRHVRIVHRFTFSACQPAGLSITDNGLAAVGCGGPAQEILNIVTGKQTSVPNVLGVDLVAANGGDFFYISFILNKFFVVNAVGKILETFTTVGASHTVAVDRCDGAVWVPEDKGNVNVYTPL